MRTILTLLLVIFSFLAEAASSPYELIMEHWKLAENHLKENSLRAAVYEYTQAINIAEHYQGITHYDIYTALIY